jgi:hypothetical protein
MTIRVSEVVSSLHVYRLPSEILRAVLVSPVRISFVGNFLRFQVTHTKKDEIAS